MLVVIQGNSTVPLVDVYHGILPVMEYGIVQVEQTNQVFVVTLPKVCENSSLSFKLQIFLSLYQIQLFSFLHALTN